MSAKRNERDKSDDERAMGEYGVVVAPATIRFERVLPGPIERVWAYLTESEKRGKWFASGQMELREGGRVELFFRHADLSPKKEPTPDRFKRYDQGHTSHGRIIRCEPPRLLSFMWGEEVGDDSEVTFELSPRGGDTLLVLTHRRLVDRAKMLSVAGGWHTHLGILVDHLNGREPRPFWSAHARIEAEYEKRLEPLWSALDDSLISDEASVKVRVSRRFSSSPERVFDACLDPEMIGKWMFGPALREEEVLHIAVDARVGGSFSFLVRRQGEEIDHVGKYREIARPRRLVFTWGVVGDSEDESVVIIEIVPVETGAELTLTHEMDPNWADYASRTEAAWAKMLDALASALG
jgi:uncharacterized protein YndB with AHSA1/START domain